MNPENARTDPRESLGRVGESAALGVYERHGFRTIARNWRCGLGEVDLVVERGGLLVFCEVKTRRTDGFGGGHDAVTWTKRRKLRQLAEVFIGDTRVPHDAVRFDVASVSIRSGEPRVELFEDAF